jgi:hypothetical protein
MPYSRSCNLRCFVLGAVRAILSLERLLRWCAVGIGVLAVGTGGVLAADEPPEVRIEMDVERGMVSRKSSVRGGGSASETGDVALRLLGLRRAPTPGEVQAAFATAVAPDATPTGAQGAWQSQLPSEINNTGRCIVRTGSFGRSIVYDEVFGVDHAEHRSSTIERRVGLVCDLLATLTGSQLAEDTCRASQSWLKVQLKRCAHALVGANMAVGTVPSREDEVEYARRVLATWTCTDLGSPALWGVPRDEWMETRIHHLMSHRTLAGAIATGLSEFGPEPHRLWTRLGDPAEFLALWSRFLAEDSEAAETVRRWVLQALEGPGREGLSTPAVDQVCRDVGAQLAREDLASLFGSFLVTQDCMVRVELACSSLPFRTNGEWTDSEGRVGWVFRLPRRGVKPVACYCGAATPAVVEQERVFGRVLLEGRALAAYLDVLARHPADVQAEWDGALEKAASLRAEGGDPFSAMEPVARRVPAIRDLVMLLRAAAKEGGGWEFK